MALILSVNKRMAGLAEPILFTVNAGSGYLMRRFDLMMKSFPTDRVIGSCDIMPNEKGTVTWTPPPGTDPGDVTFYAQLTPCFLICDKTNEVTITLTPSGAAPGTFSLYATPTELTEGGSVTFNIQGVPNEKIELMKRQFPLDIKVISLYLDAMGTAHHSMIMDYSGGQTFYAQSFSWGVLMIPEKTNEVMINVKPRQGEDPDRDPGDIFGGASDFFKDFFEEGMADFKAVAPSIIIVIIVALMIYFIVTAAIPQITKSILGG